MCGWLKEQVRLVVAGYSDRADKVDGRCPTPAKSKAVLDAMLKMKKIVIADLQHSFNQAGSTHALK